MISKGKNALIIFKNCLNKFFEVMYGGLSKDSIKTVRQREGLCLRSVFVTSRNWRKKSRNVTPENSKISQKVCR